MVNSVELFLKSILYRLFGKNIFFPLVKIQKNNKIININNNSDILIIIHIYYTEYIEEIVSYLKNIKYDYDVYISVCERSSVENINNIFSALAKNIIVNVHPNRGRDVGPFVTIMNSSLLDKYKYACKIHAKGSKYSSLGSEWRNDILTELMGSSERVDSILTAMKSDSRIGLVGPSGHHLSSYRYWGDNKCAVTAFCRKINIPPEDVVLDFFAGTMFWFRPCAISKLKQLRLSLNNIEPESGQRDGTAAHALERLFNLVVNSSGYYCTGSSSPSEKIVHGDDSNNRVIVIS